MSVKPLQQFPRDKQIAPQSAQLMRHVLYALLPGLLLCAVFYGVGVFIQLALAWVTALGCEWGVARLRTRKLTSLDVSTGLLTAALIALSIPPTAPAIVIICATAFGLLLGKHVYGGVGMNIFNPAMVGFCAVYLSFSADISLYPQGFIGFSDTLSLIFSQGDSNDALTGATALSALKANGQSQLSAVNAWWLNLAWLIGGLYLWLRNFADWRLSLTFIGVFAVATLIFAPFSQLAVSFSQHIGLGALIFTACFIITDPTTAATGRKGRILYAALCALLAVIIRQFSNMPDSMAFSVLLANACAPLIDSLTRPQYYRGKS